MAIIPETQYPGKITPASSDYPYGQARNITLPGDGTGTPWEAALVNDIFGFQQALLAGADITPSGDPETATESQYLAALRALGVFQYNAGTEYSEGQFALTAQGAYRSLVGNNTGNDPDTDSGANWDKIPTQGETIVRTTGRPALKSLPTLAGRKASLPGLGGKTIFTFDDSDLSAEVGADQQEGVYIPPDSDPTGASGAWVRDGAEYELNLYWFGASGDYDPDTETPGKIAVTATDNFDAINGARFLLEFRNRGRLVIEGGLGNSDFYFGNMPRFQLSNCEIYIARGTTVRITTPSSFGSIITVGEVGASENVKVWGGGTVRGYLPELDGLALWQAETAYPAETYIKTSANHVYWTEEGGTTGTTEPTVIAGSETDGTVVWRDALNENCISVSGNVTRVEGMHVTDASNKGITCQSPPWRDCWVIGNVVGSTHHDGIELKGNQGAVGQEELFGARGKIRDNIVQSAGRHGIHVEQPSSGLNKNEDVEVLDNVVVAAGVRHTTEDHHGIRINRCIRPVVRGNTVISATGNGVFFRQCEDVRGDISVVDYGIWAAYFQDCDGVEMSSIDITGTGGGANEAIRWQGNTGTCWVGKATVRGSGYTYAHAVLSGVTPRIGDADFLPGTSGTIDGDSPLLAASAITNTLAGVTEESGSASVPATDRSTFVSVTGRKASVISGAVYGPPGIRLEIIADGGGTMQLTGTTAVDSVGNEFTLVPIPPVTAFDSLTIRANNNTGSAKTITWHVLYS